MNIQNYEYMDTRKLVLLLISPILILSLLYAQTPLQLVPLSDATHTAQTSGNWSSASTWGGAVPNNGARVVIPNGVSVTIASMLNTRIKTLRLDGKLQFDNSTNTALKVETFIGSMMSELEMGTATNPIPQNISATITFIDEGALDLNWDYNQFSKGMVMMGQTSIYGAAKKSWIKLSANATVGTATLSLAETPTGWQIGDEIVITGTDPFNPSSDEKRTITAISGQTLILNTPLLLDHTPLKNDLDVHVANLSRNILFHSENPTIKRRGHIMFMHNTQVEVHHARFYQLGRTDKRVQIDDWYFPNLDGTDATPGARTNIRGRYSVHFHRGGVSPTTTPLATIKGCVVEDDPGWAYVNHSSHVDFIENVSYNIVGGAFQTEAGDEIGSFQRNIAIRTVNPDFPLLDPNNAPVDIREDTQDFAFQGDAYWLHGGRISVEDNIASGASGHGFIYWTEGLREAGTGIPANVFLAQNLPNGQHLPMGSCNTWWAPLISFKGNVAYSVTKGFQSLYIHSTLFEDYDDLSTQYLSSVHSTIEDFTAWNVREIAMDLNHTERVTIKNVRLENDFNLNSGVLGIKNHIMNREMVWENMQVRGFELGMEAPTRGNITITGGVFSNLVDISISPIQLANKPFYTRDLRIECVDFEASPYFSNTTNIKMNGAEFFDGSMVENFEDVNRTFLVPDRITIDTDLHGEGRLYFNEQAATYTPITNSNLEDATGQYASDILNRSNQQLQNNLGLCFAGAILPTNATNVTGITGGKRSSTDIVPMNYPACMYMNESIINIAPNQFDNYNLYTCWNGTSQKVGGTISAYAHATSACGANGNVKLIEVKVMLQGAYNSSNGNMETDLQGNNLLPLSDPYGLNESATSIPANVVDWVQIEIRDAANSATILATRAAFLRNDGTVLDLDGTLGVSFSNLNVNSGYVAVRHRNHLGVMTNAPVNFTSTNPTNGSNNILPLGASRVEGDRPNFESYRYELWKQLVDGAWNFDLLGSEAEALNLYAPHAGQLFDTDHEGHGGFTSGDILNNLNAWLAAAGGTPDIVLFSSPGGNDALNGLPFQDAVDNVNDIIDILQAANPNVTIIIEQLAPAHSTTMTPALTNFIQQMQQEVLTIASNQSTTTSDVIAVDMYTGFQDSYLADDVHYNQAGANFIASRYYTVLLGVLD